MHNHLAAPDNEIPAKGAHVIYAAYYWGIRLEVVGFHKASASVVARGVFERGFWIEIVGAAVCASVRVDKFARDIGHQSAVGTVRLLTKWIINLGACQVAGFPGSEETIV